MSDNHQAEPTFALTFTQSEWGMIRAGLYELPAKIAVPIISKLEKGLNEEVQRRQLAALAPVEPKTRESMQ